MLYTISRRRGCNHIPEGKYNVFQGKGVRFITPLVLETRPNNRSIYAQLLKATSLRLSRISLTNRIDIDGRGLIPSSYPPHSTA